jgi:hypothetical protein
MRCILSSPPDGPWNSGWHQSGRYGLPENSRPWSAPPPSPLANDAPATLAQARRVRDVQEPRLVDKHLVRGGAHLGRLGLALVGDVGVDVPLGHDDDRLGRVRVEEPRHGVDAVAQRPRQPDLPVAHAQLLAVAQVQVAHPALELGGDVDVLTLGQRARAADKVGGLVPGPEQDVAEVFGLLVRQLDGAHEGVAVVRARDGQLGEEEVVAEVAHPVGRVDVGDGAVDGAVGMVNDGRLVELWKCDDNLRAILTLPGPRLNSITRLIGFDSAVALGYPIASDTTVLKIWPTRSIDLKGCLTRVIPNTGGCPQRKRHRRIRRYYQRGGAGSRSGPK